MAKGDNYVLNNREELEKVLAQYGNKLVGFINCYVNNVAAAED